MSLQGKSWLNSLICLKQGYRYCSAKRCMKCAVIQASQASPCTVILHQSDHWGTTHGSTLWHFTRQETQLVVTTCTPTPIAHLLLSLSLSIGFLQVLYGRGIEEKVQFLHPLSLREPRKLYSQMEQIYSCRKKKPLKTPTVHSFQTLNQEKTDIWKLCLKKYFQKLLWLLH